MAKPELGTKRQCQSCGAKFYDLNKSPITCPKCGAAFALAAVAVGAAASRRAAEAARAEEEDTEADTAAGPELVSLDEVEAEEAEKDIPIDGVEIEDDIAEDDTFLEEEEEGDDDVSDLIDGDIEDDEEA
ncbi:TIGR02300 family protein [Alsobacter sp. R-9]